MPSMFILDIDNRPELVDDSLNLAEIKQHGVESVRGKKFIDSIQLFHGRVQASELHDHKLF